MAEMKLTRRGFFGVVAGAAATVFGARLGLTIPHNPKPPKIESTEFKVDPVSEWYEWKEYGQRIRVSRETIEDDVTGLLARRVREARERQASALNNAFTTGFEDDWRGIFGNNGT